MRARARVRARITVRARVRARASIRAGVTWQYAPSVYCTVCSRGSPPLLQRVSTCMSHTSTPLLRSQRPQRAQAQQAQRVKPVKSVAESQVQPKPPAHHCCHHQPAGTHPRWARQRAQASKAQAQAAKAQAAQAQARAGSVPRSMRPRRARLRQSWAAVSSWAMARRSQTQAWAST